MPESQQTDAQPFALLVTSTAGMVRIPDSHTEYRKTRLEEYLTKHPNLRDVVCMADTTTTTNDISHCEQDTVVHDGNNTYTSKDEKQDDIDKDTWVVD